MGERNDVCEYKTGKAGAHITVAVPSLWLRSAGHTQWPSLQNLLLAPSMQLFSQAQDVLMDASLSTALARHQELWGKLHNLGLALRGPISGTSFKK